MYIVVRRGAFDSIDEGGRLAGIAAVNVLQRVRRSPDDGGQRPGKVVLRARSPSQWARVLEEPHAAAGDGVVALPPRRRSERGEVLTQAAGDVDGARAAPATRTTPPSSTR